MGLLSEDGGGAPMLDILQSIIARKDQVLSTEETARVLCVCTTHMAISKAFDKVSSEHPPSVLG